MLMRKVLVVMEGRNGEGERGRKCEAEREKVNKREAGEASGVGRRRKNYN